MLQKQKYDMQYHMFLEVMQRATVIMHYRGKKCISIKLRVAAELQSCSRVAATHETYLNPVGGTNSLVYS